MVPPKSLANFLVSFAAIVFLHSRFCRSQGNNNSICINGKCGAFGVCNSQESPICTCLQGFSPRNNLEWSSENWSSGCERKVPLNCDAIKNRTSDGFLRIQVMWSDFSDLWPAQENQCQRRCLTNCSCLAYAYDGRTGCRFWARPLLYIQKFSSDSGSFLYIRLSSSELEQKKGSKKVIIIVVVVGFIIISICTFSSWKWFAKRRGRRNVILLGTAASVDTSLEDALSQVNLQDLPLFKFEILVNATDNFCEANKLGKGGFGPVYKGELTDGREIAVKRLAQESGQGMQEFMNEVVLISKLQHRNLVRLYGCCTESQEIMLIYEYMPNKSLDFFLFDSSQEVLDWSKRFNIIEGICRGLLYLHRDSRLKIIHRDLKPSNILLDSDWNPKISDFGMARIFGTKKDHVSTARVVGTLGYMAPEYAMKGRFSEKSDVFSFGVLILEIATGIRNASFIHQQGSLNLLGHVWKLWNEDNVAGLIDERIASLMYRDEVMKCIHIGLLCVQELPLDRPSVSSVLSMLSTENIKLPEPKKPAFSIKTNRNDAAGTSSSQQSQKSSSSNNNSNNNVTFSMIDGR